MKERGFFFIFLFSSLSYLRTSGKKKYARRVLEGPRRSGNVVCGKSHRNLSSAFDTLLVAFRLGLLLPPPLDDFLEFLVGDLFIALSKEYHGGVGQGNRDANSEGGNLCTFTLTRLGDNVSLFYKHDRCHAEHSRSTRQQFHPKPWQHSRRRLHQVQYYWRM